jgi:hypothetical protein
MTNDACLKLGFSDKDRVEIKQQPHRQPYGLTEFEVRDPNGYILVFSELIQ